VAWAREDPFDYMPARMSVLDESTHEFGPAQLVSGIYAQVDHLRVDMNPQGDAVLVWRDDYRIYARGTWDPAAKGRLTMSVNVRKQLTVSGKLSPANPGKSVSVTLYRKQNGAFKQLNTKTSTLNGSSEYSASFLAPRPGTCKAKATFDGDGVVLPTKVTKTFSC
jgi:hypothetical protein